MWKTMTKVLVIGSGMTGAASASLLKQHLPANTSITVWDKGREAGGRMSVAYCPDNPLVTADHGAQYITLTKEYSAKRQSLYDDLQSRGILKTMQGKIEGPNNFDNPGAQHFVMPQGSNSLVIDFLQRANAYVKYQYKVSNVSFKTGDRVSVTTQDYFDETFDIVILTIPVPQILQLGGSLYDSIGSQPSVKEKLSNVTYSSRYAVSLFFPPNTDLQYPWCSKYISDNPCVRYITIDQARRGVVNPNQGQSMVVHTSVPFGLAHLEVDLNTVKDEILGHIWNILPDLPKPLSIIAKRWRYSQVHQAYEGTPGCVTLSTDPLVILAGDGFSCSTFDGCLDSAEAVLKAVKDKMVPNPGSGL